jgi:hypothetical protein
MGGRIEIIDGKQIWVRFGIESALQDVLPNLNV